jgi:hypothetical protein
MKFRKPSPALAISIIALCVALGGSAYAATVITSKEIRNGTIQNVDIKKGTIQSTRLSSGLQKILKKGPSLGGSSVSGSSAGTVATEAIRKSGPENQPPGQLITVATMTIPPGAYVITANTVMTAFTGTSSRRSSTPTARVAGRARSTPRASTPSPTRRSPSTTARRRRRSACSSPAP